MAVTLKENSGRSRTENEGPIGRLLQSSWDPRTQVRQKTPDTRQRDNRGRTDGHLTDCIWRRGGVGAWSGEMEGAKVLLRSTLEKNSDPGGEVGTKQRSGVTLTEAT